MAKKVTMAKKTEYDDVYKRWTEQFDPDDFLTAKEAAEVFESWIIKPKTREGKSKLVEEFIQRWKQERITNISTALNIPQHRAERLLDAIEKLRTEGYSKQNWAQFWSSVNKRDPVALERARELWRKALSH